MDRFDRQLLNLIQDDCAQTAEALSGQVALSVSAIQRRLRRLKDDGVIVRETAVLDPRKLGSPTVFVVSLQVERERPELLARLRAWVSAESSVQQAYYVTGEADFVLVMTSPSTEAFDETMMQLMADNPNVRRFTTNVVLGIVKRSLTVPVPVDLD